MSTVSTENEGTASAYVRVAWQPAIEDFVSLLSSSLVGFGRHIGVVPSTLDRSDQRLAGLRGALCEQHVRARVFVPRSPASLATSVLSPRRASAWTTIQSDGTSWRTDSRLLKSRWLAFTIVDETTKTGPFVLDLPSRFLHPVDRVKLLARPDRQWLVADIAAPVLPSVSFVSTAVAGGWLAIVTTDPVAAELWALVLAERHLDQRMEMQGPWEDAAVQRATELELGVRIPTQIRLRFAAGVSLPESASGLLAQVGQRLGMRIAEASG